MPRVKRIAEVLDILKQKDQIRNIGIIAHVDHGKTTTTDSLLAAAGLLSPTLAGKALALDYLEEEQQRQMTIKAANISLYYEMNGKPYVINLIDTPGHVDFSGRVTRALRAIDGAVVVVDAVEGVMTQTETVVRQALEERVKPVLYINKIDRLIKELRLTPEKIQETLVRFVMDINRLIEMYAEPQYKQEWKVSFQNGSVAIGSAKDRWGFTVPQAQKRGIKFKDVMNAFVNNDIDWLRENAPPILRATDRDAPILEAHLPLLFILGLGIHLDEPIDIHHDPDQGLLNLLRSQPKLLDQPIDLIYV